MNNKYVCVEGNIGAGKTTFVKAFAENSNYTPIYERFSENPFLELFYKNPKDHAFPLEMSFLAERFQQLNDIFSKPDLFEENYVSDYCFLKTLIFAEINLLPEEFRVFRSFHNILNQSLVAPSCIIYLETELEYLQKNIKIRDRLMEQDIDRGYLNSIAGGYRQWLFSSKSIPLIVIPYTEQSWSGLHDTIGGIKALIDSDVSLPNLTVWK